MIRNFILWFCAPWAIFFGIAGVMYLFRHPDKLVLLLPIMVLLVFAIRAEYVRMIAKADSMPGDIGKPKREAAGSDASPFNPRSPGQLTSFAFRYGLPPGVLERKLLPASPPALPPPAEDA